MIIDQMLQKYTVMNKRHKRTIVTCISHSKTKINICKTKILATFAWIAAFWLLLSQEHGPSGCLIPSTMFSDLNFFLHHGTSRF